MDERINESLSALVDGETDELEVRRLLKQSETDGQVLETWHRYQLIGSIMRGEPVAQIDLSRGVRQAIDGEPMDELITSTPATEAKSKRSWYVASGAVAASMMLAVLVGVQWQMQEQDAPAVASAQISPAMHQLEKTAPVVLASVSAVPATANTASESTLNQEQLEEAQRKLQEYVFQHGDVLQHGDQSSPFARTVKFNQE
ncbi:MAG: sigma-E factor negative regulatory protein [Venatoribacter sp.]